MDNTLAFTPLANYYLNLTEERRRQLFRIQQDGSGALIVSFHIMSTNSNSVQYARWHTYQC